ncbi:MAG: type 1 fimbrial protein [Ottowia sp.]|nr:type 1 fimbrial protein [Ottowia sp.]
MNSRHDSHNFFHWPHYWLILLLIGIVLLSLSTYTHAQCQAMPSPKVLHLATTPILANPSLPMGGVIKTSTITTPHHNITCPQSSISDTFYRITIGRALTSVGFANSVCATNLPGVGLRIRLLDGPSLRTQLPTTEDGYLPCQWQSNHDPCLSTTCTKNLSLASQQNDTATFEIQLIKTAPHPNGTLLLDNVLSITHPRGLINMSGASVAVATQSPSCIVTTAGKNTQVHMGRIEAGRLQLDGTSKISVQFSIPLYCEAGATAALQIDGPVGKPAWINNVVAPGSARQVGIALYFSGTPIQFAQRIALSPTLRDGPVNFPLEARYQYLYGLGPGSSGGVINGFVMASATFTLILP